MAGTDSIDIFRDPGRYPGFGEDAQVLLEWAAIGLARGMQAASQGYDDLSPIKIPDLIGQIRESGHTAADFKGTGPEATRATLVHLNGGRRFLDLARDTVGCIAAALKLEIEQGGRIKGGTSG